MSSMLAKPVSEMTEEEIDAAFRELKERHKRRGWWDQKAGDVVEVLGVSAVVHSASGDRIVLYREGYTPRVRRRSHESETEA